MKVLPAEGSKLGDAALSVEDVRANDKLGIALRDGSTKGGASGDDGDGPRDGLAAN
jgi:hypothetical protein